MSWFEPHLTTSLTWIREAAPDFSASIIDVGGGASTLLDDLYAEGFRSLTLLDVSADAIAKARIRLGTAAGAIRWVCGDVTCCSLPEAAFDIWHDRALFHFLTVQEDREAYIKRMKSALKPDGQVILAAFSLDGPQTCSGLPVRRYDVASIQEQIGQEFRLTKSATAMHRTPAGVSQEFLYCRLVRR